MYQGLIDWVMLCGCFLMSWAPPDVPGLMGIFPMVAEMLFLEELEFHSFSVDSQIQWRLDPAGGLVSSVDLVL